MKIDSHENVATRCQILRLKCTKFDFGWGSTPDPAGGAYSTPPDLLDGEDGGWLLPPQDPHPALGLSNLAASVRAWTFFTNFSPLTVVLCHKNVAVNFYHNFCKPRLISIFFGPN